MRRLLVGWRLLTADAAAHAAAATERLTDSNATRRHIRRLK